MSRYDVTINVIVETNDDELRKAYEKQEPDESFQLWVREGIFEETTVSVDWPGKFWLADLDVTVD